MRHRHVATSVTLLSLPIAIGSAVSISVGALALGGWLYAAAGACDAVDGRIARATNTVSAAGAMLDSVFDRYVEASALVGLAWYFRNGWVLAPALFALVSSLLVPYVRARAEGLGVALDRVGWLKRPARVVALAAALILSPVSEALVVGVLLAISVLGQVSAIQRVAYAYRSLLGGGHG